MMGQVLDFCKQCENKRGCDDCAHLHEWIMEHLDSVQVVRCEDCKLCDKKDIWGTGKVTYECSRTDQDMGPDGFCSFGR